jgi:hypothetical protein
VHQDPGQDAVRKLTQLSRCLLRLIDGVGHECRSIATRAGTRTASSLSPVSAM